MKDIRSRIKKVSNKVAGGIWLSCLIVVMQIAACTIFAAAVPSADAATISVNTTDDELNADGDCSLREAVRSANIDTAVDTCVSGSGSDEIIFESSAVPGVFTLSITGKGENDAVTGDLDIIGDITITGAGVIGSVIDGGGIDRVFHILSGTVDISGVTIRNGGDASDGGGSGINNLGTLTLNNSVVSGNSGISGSGGGISNDGTLTLNGSVVDNNSVDGSGGGIFNTGTLTLTDSAVSDNSALQGGGIDNSGVLILNNSTVSDNSAFSESGGGISNIDLVTMTNSTISGNSAATNGGGINNFGTVNLNNVTITDNAADSNGIGGSDGGGIFNLDDTDITGTVNFKSTIIAGNMDNGGEAPDCFGTLSSQGFNLIQDASGCTIDGNATGNIIGQDASLDSLADNGGSTRTHALFSDGPAIDAGNPAIPGSGSDACEATDQRGFIRPADGDGDSNAACDIGAFELDAVEPTPSPSPTPGDDGDNGCSMAAGSGEPGQAAVNFLIPLISAFAIGFRLRRVREGKK